LKMSQFEDLKNDGFWEGRQMRTTPRARLLAAALAAH
jgi:hypothetical protein